MMKSVEASEDSCASFDYPIKAIYVSVSINDNYYSFSNLTQIHRVGVTHIEAFILVEIDLDRLPS